MNSSVRERNHSCSAIFQVSHQQDFNEATEQPINAKNDGSPTAGIQENPFDVSVKQFSPEVQYLLGEKQAANQQKLELEQKLEKKERLYKVSGFLHWNYRSAITRYRIASMIISKV